MNRTMTPTYAPTASSSVDDLTNGNDTDVNRTMIPTYAPTASSPVDDLTNANDSISGAANDTMSAAGLGFSIQNGTNSTSMAPTSSFGDNSDVNSTAYPVTSCWASDPLSNETGFPGLVPVDQEYVCVSYCIERLDGSTISVHDSIPIANVETTAMMFANSAFRSCSTNDCNKGDACTFNATPEVTDNSSVPNSPGTGLEGITNDTVILNVTVVTNFPSLGANSTNETTNVGEKEEASSSVNFSLPLIVDILPNGTSVSETDSSLQNTSQILSEVGIGSSAVNITIPASTNGSATALAVTLDSSSAPYSITLSTESESMLSRYGISVAISGDGSVVAVGATGATNENSGEVTGAVYLYSVTESGGASSLRLLQVLYGQSDGDEFGNAIGISQDGSRIVIGSRSEGQQAGALRVFQLDSETSSSLADSFLEIVSEIISTGDGSDTATSSPLRSWSLMDGGIIVGQNPSDRAGWDVSISGDGSGKVPSTLM